jgi:hypothetical protein
MGIIHHYCRAMFSSHSTEFSQLDDVAFHAEDAIHNNQLPRVRIELLQPGFQRGHVLVGETKELALSEQTTLDNAGMIALIAYDVFAFANKRADNSEVYLEASAIEQHGLFVDQLSQGGLEFKMDI